MKKLAEAWDRKTIETKPIDVDSMAVSLDEHISSKVEPFRWKKRTGFAPSETNDCLRYLVYLFRGVDLPNDNSPRLQRIFDNGNDVHARITRYFDDMGILVDKDVEINQPSHLPVPIGPAFIDVIVKWQDKDLVGEIKSINEAGFMHRRLYKKPKDEHYKQIQLYMDAIKIDEGFVLYENKNTQEILVIYVKLDREFLDRLYKKYKKAGVLYADGILPDRPYKETSKTCKYCKLKEKCWSDEE